MPIGIWTEAPGRLTIVLALWNDDNIGVKIHNRDQEWLTSEMERKIMYWLLDPPTVRYKQKVWKAWVGSWEIEMTFWSLGVDIEPSTLFYYMKAVEKVLHIVCEASCI